MKSCSTLRAVSDYALFKNNLKSVVRNYKKQSDRL
ncbi:hypothetical protein HNQ92_002649 [Rhabdobacter roseus]|uniref:Uncharacterized protein n=1 Tax=Rhabdobacter roseus TaxID=1655419 RepID=A0A840TJX0_9BACT|nr:hypothetical protein [Rhabdobacter roseus]